MSIAKNLGAYIGALLNENTSNLPIGAQLSVDRERLAYAASIRSRARAAPSPGDIEKTGTANYKHLLNTIDMLADNRGCGTGITPTIWRKLKTLVLMLGSRADWANLETGPIYGGSNETLANRLDLSLDRTKKTLREFRIFGLIIDHDRLANGRRRIRRTADGKPYGHGLSLLPLIVRLDELRALASDYIARKQTSLKLKRRASAALRGAKQLLAGTEADQHPASAAIEAVERDLHTAFKQRDTTALETICEDLLPKQTTLQGVEIDTTHSTSHLAASPVESRQKARSGTGGAKISTEDPFGLTSSKIAASELPILFPVSADALKGARDMVDVGASLAQQSGLNEKMWSKALRKLGPTAAPFAVIVYAQHLADGEIRNAANPQSYFAGMLNAADRADLNLGATIWGRREQTGTHHARS